MKSDKEKQFKKCKKCFYLSASITKPNGAEKFIELDRKKIQDCDYHCKRENNYLICEDFLNYKKYPKDLSISEVIEKQNQDKLNKQNFWRNFIKIFAWFIGIAIAFLSAYIGYLNYLK